MRGREKPRILCVSRKSFQLETMRSALTIRQYAVLSASTPEQAVAVCVSNNVAAVVLDSEFSNDGWSAAKTFKMINPRLLIVLLGRDHGGPLPYGVDAIAPAYSFIAETLDKVLKRAVTGS
jgi:PleD family two-component response regulator